MERIRSEEIYQGRLIRVRKDTLRTAEGREVQRDVVVHPGAVVVVAVDGDDLLLVRQYRYAAGETLLELVAGSLEPGEEPAQTAARELQEEIGFAARRWTKLGEFYSSPGFTTELLYLFLAEDLYPSRLPGDEDEEIEVVRVGFSDLMKMAVSGQIRDAKTLAGILLYEQYRNDR